MAKEVRFGSGEEKKVSVKRPNHKATTLSNQGLVAFNELDKRFPDLNQPDILELAVLILRDASPSSIRKYYQGKDTVADAKVKEAKKNGKKEAPVMETTQPAGITA